MQHLGEYTIADTEVHEMADALAEMPLDVHLELTIQWSGLVKHD